MELTADQKLIHGDIQNKFLKWLEFWAVDVDRDYTYTRADLWPSECEVISITDVPLGFSHVEVWNLYLGLGDEGGPSLLTAHVDVSWKKPKVIFIAQHFDTASAEIFRISYVDGKEVWAIAKE